MKANVIDLFCGVGGLSFGLKKAGFNIPVSYTHLRAHETSLY
ncbi:DNA cytosine methyltransferase, partial [Helicobacter typhlonius]